MEGEITTCRGEGEREHDATGVVVAKWHRSIFGRAKHPLGASGEKDSVLVELRLERDEKARRVTRQSLLVEGVTVGGTHLNVDRLPATTARAAMVGASLWLLNSLNIHQPPQ